MKTKITLLIVITTIITFNFIACKKTNPASSLPSTTVSLDLPSTPYQYNSNSGFSDNVVTLGRVLFYDTHLSVNNAISCASCHKQTLAFSDNVALSNGFQNTQTVRNALPIQDIVTGTGNILFGQGGLGSPTSLFWDGREKILTNMVLKPIVNHVEMGMDDDDALTSRVKVLSYYGDLFNKAFGTSEVNATEIATAISAFVSSITSNNTRFDKFMQGQATLSGVEMQGKSLFFDKYNCNSCHQTQTVFNGYQSGGGQSSGGGESIGFVNIGLDVNYVDNGLGALDNNPADNGKFKIPNLRNVALTAPYMHDGRYAKLNDVLNHYSTGIANHPNLDPRLRGTNGTPIQMNISAEEKTAIIAFLNTLTDYTEITDPRFSNPFKTN